MKVEIKVPSMGESVVEASIGAILKPEGGLVDENDEIIELETEKLNQVLYAPKGGEISWKVNVGDTVTVGEVIGTVDTEKKGTFIQEREKKEKPSKEFVEYPSPHLTPSGDGARKMEKQFLYVKDAVKHL